MKNKYFSFVGASGVGKSTLLNYINENFSIKTMELSARPYLPKVEGSYDQTLTDESQALICMHRALGAFEQMLTGEPCVFSRSAIDNLAYQRVLGKGLFLDSASKRNIEIENKNTTYLYIPIQFPMAQTEDTVRGMNEEVRQKTDLEIQKICIGFHIDPIIISGSLEERQEQLKYHLKDYVKKIN